MFTESAKCCCTNCLPSSTGQHLSVDLLKDLNWLSVRGRVGYKIAILCYKAVKLQQPSYRTWLLSPYRQSHVLRSSMSDLLSIFIDKLCCSSVLMLCPTVYNSLPSFVCIADSFTIFGGLSWGLMFVKLSVPLMPLPDLLRVISLFVVFYSSRVGLISIHIVAVSY